MFTRFITVTTQDAYNKTRVVAIPVNNIALMEEHAMGTIITLMNGSSLDSNKIIANELIEEIISKIECDEEDWDEDDES